MVSPPRPWKFLHKFHPPNCWNSTRWNCCNSWRHHLGNWTPKGEETMSIEKCLLYDMSYMFFVVCIYFVSNFWRLFVFVFVCFVCVRVCFVVFKVSQDQAHARSVVISVDDIAWPFERLRSTEDWWQNRLEVVLGFQGVTTQNDKDFGINS